MALETLKGVREIGGFKVEPHEGEEGINWVTEDSPIYIDHEQNTITFKIQDGPIKENGVNGCQVDTIIKTAWLIIKGLDDKFPCDENKIVMTDLDHALCVLKVRKMDREKRGVEGESKA